MNDFDQRMKIARVEKGDLDWMQKSLTHGTFDRFAANVFRVNFGCFWAGS